MHGRFSTIGDTCPGCPLSLRYPTYITLYRVHLHHHTTPQISSHKFKLPVNTRSLHYAVHCSAARVQLHQCAVNRPCGAARRRPRRRPASGGRRLLRRLLLRCGAAADEYGAGERSSLHSPSVGHSSEERWFVAGHPAGVDVPGPPPRTVPHSADDTDDRTRTADHNNPEPSGALLTARLCQHGFRLVSSDIPYGIVYCGMVYYCGLVSYCLDVVVWYIIVWHVWGFFLLFFK